MDRHHQILLLFSWPSVLLASKIIAAFKISVLHKWPPEGFLLKEFSFHGQLSSYASGRKTEPWHNYNTVCSHCAVKGLDLIPQHYSSLAALSVDSGSDCVETILAGLGENEGTLLCAWWHCDRPSDSSLSLITHCPPEILSVSLLLMELISVCPALWDWYRQYRAFESMPHIYKGLAKG